MVCLLFLVTAGTTRRSCTRSCWARSCKKASEGVGARARQVGRKSHPLGDISVRTGRQVRVGRGIAAGHNVSGRDRRRRLDLAERTRRRPGTKLRTKPAKTATPPASRWWRRCQRAGRSPVQAGLAPAGTEARTSARACSAVLPRSRSDRRPRPGRARVPRGVERGRETP